jgi:hypothetical protein
MVEVDYVAEEVARRMRAGEDISLHRYDANWQDGCLEED